MRKLVALTVLILAIAFGPLGELGTKTAQASKIPAHKQAWQYKYKVWMPKHWILLATCEERLNWKHDDGVYEGTFAFAKSTWDGYKYRGYPHSAALATPWQQYRVALRVAKSMPDGIQDAWGCWRGPEHAWVRNGKPEYGTYA